MKISEFLMNNYVFSFFWYGYKFLKYRIPMLLFIIFPIKEHKVLFFSFNGKNYADNPKAVSEKLHEMYPNYEIVWGIKNLNKRKIIPEYVRIVKFGSFRWYYEMCTSKFWITNVLLPHGILKRKGQKYIQTWHGDRGIKKIVFDASKSMQKFHKRNFFRKIIEPELCDICTVGSDFGLKVFKSAFHYNGCFIKKGSPRNDCLINIDEKRIRYIKQNLNIPDGTRTILFAPTFRDHLNGRIQEIGNINILELIDILEKKTKKNWLCIQRGHIGTKLDSKYVSKKVIDLTEYEDMADLLLITDLLITDYSSSAGDFALTGKGIIFYQEDYYSYINNDRELYFKIEDSPFIVAHDQKELIEKIETLTEKDFKENSKKILDFYSTFETGMSSKAIVEYIVSHDEKVL